MVASGADGRRQVLHSVQKIQLSNMVREIRALKGGFRWELEAVDNICSGFTECQCEVGAHVRSAYLALLALSAGAIAIRDRGAHEH